MRRLALYSDQEISANQQVDKGTLQLLGKPKADIGYISSVSDPSRQYFTAKQEYYRQYSLNLSPYLELDVDYEPDLLDRLFACDGIHLSGGNTFYFLYWLRQRGLLKRLQDYATHQGVLIGVSAGAILMTPEITSAQLCGDEPYPPLTNPQGLELVDFAFVPHLEGTKAEQVQMQSYADHYQRVLYGCHDGDGIIVNDEIVTLIGNVIRIEPTNL